MKVASHTCLSWSAKLAVEEFSFCLRSLSWIVRVFGVTMGVLYPGVFVAGLRALCSWQRSPKRSRKGLIPDPPAGTVILLKRNSNGSHNSFTSHWRFSMKQLRYNTKSSKGDICIQAKLEVPVTTIRTLKLLKQQIRANRCPSLSKFHIQYTSLLLQLVCFFQYFP